MVHKIHKRKYFAENEKSKKAQKKTLKSLMKNEQTFNYKNMLS